MTRPIKTIKRTDKMANARYIITRQGEIMALLIAKPAGPIPKGHELCRIVDPPKKPKRKVATIAVWGYHSRASASSLSVRRWFNSRSEARARRRTETHLGWDCTPIFKLTGNFPGWTTPRRMGGGE